MDLEPATSTTPPDVSVVIPVHGDRGALAQTLAHLAAQHTSATMEVLVVDNGDNDGIETTTRHFGAHLVHEPTRGSYAARNAGIRASRGAVLAFTDADCRPRSDWVQRGLEALDRGGAGSFVGGRVDLLQTSGGRRLSAAEIWQFGHDLRQDLYTRSPGWAVTANLFVRRADLERAGPFHAGLHSGGDREWGERAVRAGLRCCYADDAVVDHPTRATMAALLTKVRRVATGTVAVSRTTGAPLYHNGYRALVPPLRATWRRAHRLADRPLERALLVPLTAAVHVYRRTHEARALATALVRARTAPGRGDRPPRPDERAEP